MCLLLIKAAAGEEIAHAVQHQLSVIATEADGTINENFNPP